MPRAGKYTPWTLKTAVLLASTMTAAERGAIPEPDWREEGKKGKGGKEVRHTVEGAEGRPHYEEAVLIQLRGTVNNPACAKCADGQGPFLSCKSVSTAHFGACGCCVWESKAIDCTLQAVQDIRASRNAARKLVQDNKATTRELRGNVSSKNTRKTMVEGDAGPKGAAGRKKNAGRAKKPTGTRRNTRQSAADEE